MKADRNLILWFRDVGKGNVERVGGKGANLGELTKAKVTVPPGFIVSADAYFSFIDATGLRSAIAKLTSNLDYNDSSSLQQVAETLKTALCSAPLPPELAQEVRVAYRKLGGGPVAVRSSATAEDMAQASFAGQQATFLNVEGSEEVVGAVRDCWASLFEARALFYRHEAGFEHLAVGIAVVVQRMVQSQRSGVMFTVEPVSGDPGALVLEAIYGLGEAVVSGQVTPDTYIVDKEKLNILQKELHPQEQQLVRNPAAHRPEEANLWSQVPAALSQRQKLSDDEVVSLAKLGLQIERYYNFPQDIEWAEEEGQFYVVQARPVTTAVKQARARRETAWESARVILSGSAASPGVECGRVRIVLSHQELDKVRRGDVLVAEMTTPDYVPAMKRAAAIVTDRGGRTAHAAIVSRELGIPCVVATGNASRALRDGQMVTVDGDEGKVFLGRAEVRLAWAAQEKVRRASTVAIETRTKLYVNLAQPDLAKAVAARHADGVGLLRAEFMMAQIGEHPRLVLEEGRGEAFVAKLTKGITQFAKAFHPRPVVYRTNDFKTNEYRNLRGGEKYEPTEENPMLGYRGASRYIGEPEVFALELEAIKKVRQDYDNLWVMIPFVRTPEGMGRVKEIVEAAGLRRSEDFKLWMMAEIPSNVLLINEFIDVGIDGISIGSNDLTQLILGVDRDNGILASEFDERDPAVMQALAQLITTARQRGITSSICGQAPSFYPELTEKLVEWGITSISVAPDTIERTREIIARAEARMAGDAR